VCNCERENTEIQRSVRTLSHHRASGVSKPETNAAPPPRAHIGDETIENIPHDVFNPPLHILRVRARPWFPLQPSTLGFLTSDPSLERARPDSSRVRVRARVPASFPPRASLASRSRTHFHRDGGLVDVALRRSVSHLRVLRVSFAPALPPSLPRRISSSESPLLSHDLSFWEKR